MRLSELARIEGGFALLGPGFLDGDALSTPRPGERGCGASEGGFLLLRGLREIGEVGPGATLALARFEASRPEVALYAAASVDPLDGLELDVEAPRLAIELDAQGYEEKIERIREAIACGDVYQVCLTARARVGDASAGQLLATMCARGVPRFAAWVRLPGETAASEIVSASPELFFETAGRRVHTEPMKGTARAGAGEKPAELEASEKDRAELAMITDLLRNDLTRLCRPRTVRVEHERRLIELPYALQTVSDVVGELSDGVTPLDVLEALHPGGSVTGAPKPAALAMIRELERDAGPRGPYCGALGLLRGERSTFSLLIRTAFRPGPHAPWTYGVGGGIVYDSDARREVEELRTKLGALRCDTPSSP